MPVPRPKWSKPHWILPFLSLTLALADKASAQAVATDLCAQTPANEYVVDADCMPFLVPASYGADYDPGGCGNLGKDAFGWFTATSDSTTVGIVPNNNADIGLQVFSGSCGALTMLDCADEQGPAGIEELTVATVIGQNYWVRVQLYTPQDSLPYGKLCVFQTPPLPVNSTPCSATLLPVTTTCNGVVAGTNVSSVTTQGLPATPCYYPGSSGDVWFKAVVPPNGHLLIDTWSLIPFDGAMAVYTTTDCTDPAQFTYVDCADEGSSTGNWMPMLDLTSGLTVGDTAYIRFWAFFGAEEDFRICASSGSTTLPVEFLSFQAEARDTAVLLSWATATEQYSDRFEVQRSTDGRQFTTVGTLAAAGQSQQRIDYTYLDNTAVPGTNFYRVREVDRDGAAQFTQALVVFTAVVEQQALLIYPNPVADELRLGFGARREGTARVAVLDLAGRTLREKAVQVKRGRMEARLDLRPLAKGTYIARVTLPSGQVIPGGTFIKL